MQTRLLAVLAGCAGVTTGQPPPTRGHSYEANSGGSTDGTTSYLRDLPRRILHQPCRMVLDGDSIGTDGLESRMFCGLIRRLTPDRTSGVGNTAMMINGGLAGVAGYSDRSPSGNVRGRVR